MFNETVVSTSYSFSEHETTVSAGTHSLAGAAHIPFTLASPSRPLAPGGSASALPCSLEVSGLSLRELSLFVGASYLARTTRDFKDYMNTFLPEWTTKEVVRADNSPVSFYDFYSAEKNVSVVAVKASTLERHF